MQIKRQGQEKYVLENKPLVYVKDIRQHLEIIINNEASEQEFEVMEDGTKKVVVGLTADAGGGSMKFSISLMNNKENRFARTADQSAFRKGIKTLAVITVLNSRYNSRKLG